MIAVFPLVIILAFEIGRVLLDSRITPSMRLDGDLRSLKSTAMNKPRGHTLKTTDSVGAMRVRKTQTSQPEPDLVLDPKLLPFSSLIEMDE